MRRLMSMTAQEKHRPAKIGKTGLTLGLIAQVTHAPIKKYITKKPHFTTLREIAQNIHSAPAAAKIIEPVKMGSGPTNLKT